jgi:hypothetical protein
MIRRTTQLTPAASPTTGTCCLSAGLHKRVVAQNLREWMNKRFVLSDQDLLEYYLGVEISHQDDNMLLLDHIAQMPVSRQAPANTIPFPRTRGVPLRPTCKRQFLSGV